MLRTIKSKIIALTGAVLFLLLVIMSGISFFNFQNNKSLIINGNNFNIDRFIGQINSEMGKLEDSVLNLALLGEFYVKNNYPNKILDQMVVQSFESYPHSLGGGIWFKPYAVNPKKRLKAVYAYHNPEGKVVLDSNFESDDYDYPMQRWYLQILPRLSREKNLVWSVPYHENQGSKTFMTTVGAGIYHQEKLIGLATADWQMTSLLKIISALKPTQNSFVLFADKKNDFVISVTDPYLKDKKVWGLSLKLIPWYNEGLATQSEFRYHGVTYIPYIRTLDNGMILIINTPKEDLFRSSIHYFNLTFSLLLIACLCIAAGIYFILQRNINKPIALLTKNAEKIGQGNLDVKIQLEKPEELSNLATTLNKMTHDLKENLIHITDMSKAKEKMEAELSVAHNIQKDALPHVFPINSGFELIASMKTARDVGGDFYDFFPIDETHFAFIMADVSGKGITAALFMMSAKTMIKNILQSGCTLEQVAKKVNKGLYDNNSRGMFLTAFICVIDIKTGEVEYINAGHCPPLIRSKEGYKYFQPLRNLMLGVMPAYKYQIGSFKLKPNERIFLYTDGVTEAQDKDEKLFGADRLEKTLNKEITSLPDTLKRVSQAIDKYVNGAEQSDDITMMEFIYYGLNSQSKIFLTDVQVWPDVSTFIQEKVRGTAKQKQSFELVGEEIFTNIAKYAYTDKGTVRLEIQNKADGIQMKFSDWGKPYNPLPIKKPKTKAKIADRKIGGLGLYLVDKIADNITYQRIDGQNILTITMKR